MKLLQITLLACATLIATSCQSKVKKNTISENSEMSENQYEEIEEEVKLSPQQLSKYETAYFASGCFWCVEAIFESVKGVKEVVSGYAGGEQKNPTYEEVGYGKTDHAEAVEVYYDPNEISFTQLVQVFFGSHDPTQLNRQGPDRGRQYRSIAFYKTDEQKKIIESYIQALTDNKVYDNDPITTEVVPYTVFYKAESYHQDYEKNNPNNSYIRNVSIPRLNRFKANFGDYLKKSAH
ncbi:peptide-methionine (S)-S-oxide reductase MsrA [Maribacter sp. SA7]|uniref:peptide-methionine (S)-S-oxide reductase MsrA n=1 Tax=Maribacter zhoushanensis TaxID=3030012 RepID=UPI0023EAF2ED|nr:peptide-methionine (S)-S-oxide reductase MsrA [Maribacter zhoushanensis]MDF4202457.1 peptide-methionine (S)-S-oxide reductase MsrA [Maribacter zhoushanensis]